MSTEDTEITEVIMIFRLFQASLVARRRLSVVGSSVVRHTPFCR